MSGRSVPRRARLLLALACVLASLAGLGVVQVTTAAPAQAASAADFRAGNIISDAVFWDASTMAPWDVQAFLNGKVSSCQAGYTCLKDYRENTWTRPADAQCAQYNGVAGQTAADIIWNVAQACQVNPRVLLVLLQKETSLVTKTNPTWDNAYKKATGYGCPDTAPCDAQYYGFYNQVYKAAWQYRRYAVNWRNYSYQAGRWNTIQWHPNAACGTTSVYIENQATAGLYIYTPYPPNQAAMNNLYGTGDGCSSYGNRNFWRMFTDWFGSTQYSVVGEIDALWQRMGGIGGALGAPVGARYPTWGNGWTQGFQNGRIHYSPATGAQAVLAPISWAYDPLMGESGPLGYPVGPRYATWGNGWTQGFQNGRIHYSPTTGTHAVLAPISAAYDALLGESGPLGYPVGDRYQTAGNGWVQGFQNGRIHWSPTTGAHAVLAPISPAYDELLGESGPLGYPVGGRYQTVNSGWVQGFEKGRIHYSPATGAHAVIGGISTAYDALLGESGPLGYPTGDRYPTPGNGFTQTFQNGRIHWSPATGGHAVVAPIAATYDSLTGESGPLGYPVGSRYATPGGGWTQAFQNGRIHSSPASGTFAVLSPISTAYDPLLGESGPLGYPVGARYRTWNDGWTQAFQNGRIHYSPTTGAHAVLAPISATYDALLGESGPLGYPVGDRYQTAGGGWTQAFQNGRIHWSPTTGAHAVLAPLSPAYDALLGESGPLGYPTADRARAAGSGWVQVFENGRIYWSSTTGAHAVRGSVAQAYAAAGAESGELGYPTGDLVTEPDGAQRQDFQHGSIRWTSADGATVTLTTD
ncbi:hypothetical protein GCM10027261_30250 [Geodermatophilus arenarius]|uniref:LGFP repeat-containing protein n=1 Tax=Geodermatophilus arenarius TaxID=1137990 RepID=A0ABV9LP57_9ACTN